MNNTLVNRDEIVSYSIYFPTSYLLIDNKFSELQKQNPDIQLKIQNKNQLDVIEHKYSFHEYGRIHLRLSGLTEEQFEELAQLNEGLNFEFDNREEVWIKMGIFRLIGKITAKILASFVNWATNLKSGEVYADPTGYKISDPKNIEDTIYRIPDISYISYQTATEQTQNSWTKNIPIPPNMALEIVSGKYGLKGDLDKMQTVWTPLGVDVGIVVCPFTETIYLFEKGKTGYTTQSIYNDFTHPFLPEYKDNFGQYLDKTFL